MIKNPSNYTTQELLEILKQEEEYKPILYNYPSKNDVLNFILFFNLEPGNDTVTNNLLYQLYCNWSEEKTTKQRFMNNIKKYFKTELPFIYINKTALKITEEVYKLIEINKVDKTKNKDQRLHFENFLENYKLKSGTKWIESVILYSLYDEWCYKNKKKNPMGTQHFYGFCRLYLPNKRRTSSKIIWYGVDESFLESIGVNKIERIRKGYAQKNKKKYGKVSRT